MTFTRRKILASASALAGLAAFREQALADADEVRVGIIPTLSGALARQGHLMVQGAELAVEDINAAGGIKALGGARMRLVVADAGESIDSAKNAAQRLASQSPQIVAGCGSFVSPFSLAITEVTERAGLPWLTFAYTDQITKRGFHHVFKTTPPAGDLSAALIPMLMQLAQSATGRKPKTVGLLRDDTTASAGMAQALGEGILKKEGLELVVNETFTPPLSDATTMVQRVRQRKPDFVLILMTALPDNVLVLQKFREFHINVPKIGAGGLLTAPEMRTLVDPALLEGAMSISGNWTSKQTSDVERRFTAKTGEPWMTEPSISCYGDMWTMKEALEKAGKADRLAVSDALHALDTNEGAARFYIGGRLKFDSTGQREGALPAIAAWINGRVETVFPLEAATAKAVWPS